MLNPNLTKTEAEWLLNVYQPKKDGIVNGTTIPMFIKAINYIRGTNSTVPSCGCEYLTRAKMANSYFEQYKTEIETIANKTTRGRKKTNQ